MADEVKDALQWLQEFANTYAGLVVEHQLEMSDKLYLETKRIGDVPVITHEAVMAEFLKRE